MTGAPASAPRQDPSLRSRMTRRTCADHAVRTWQTQSTPLLLQKIRQQPLPLLGEKTLRMILHALQRPGLVADAHDLFVGRPTADLELRRQRAVADDQAVVPRRRERIRHAGVN